MLSQHEDYAALVFWVDSRVVELVNMQEFYKEVIPYPHGPIKTVSVSFLRNYVTRGLKRLKHRAGDAEVHAVAYGVMDYWRDYFPPEWYDAKYLDEVLPMRDMHKEWVSYTAGDFGVDSCVDHANATLAALTRGVGVPAYILNGGEPAQQGVPTTMAKAEDEGISIKTVTYIDDLAVDSYTVSALAEKIAKEEAALAKLEQLQTKPKRVAKNIAERRQKLAELVATLDKLDDEVSAK